MPLIVKVFAHWVATFAVPLALHTCGTPYGAASIANARAWKRVPLAKTAASPAVAFA